MPYPYKARLVLDIEMTDGKKKTIEMHELQFGPGIYYVDENHDVVRETQLEISQFPEILYDPINTVRKVIRPGREFVEIKLLAEMIPVENDLTGTETMREINHWQVEEGVDPYSLMLGRKDEPTEYPESKISDKARAHAKRLQDELKLMGGEDV